MTYRLYYSSIQIDRATYISKHPLLPFQPARPTSLSIHTPTLIFKISSKSQFSILLDYKSLTTSPIIFYYSLLSIEISTAIVLTHATNIQ